MFPSRKVKLLIGTRILATVAELTGRTRQQLRDQLGRRGVRVSSDDVTLADVADQNPIRLLETLLQDE